MTRRPAMPLPCPICGRPPKVTGYVIQCHRSSRYRDHLLRVESDSNLYPVAAWNRYVRRIRGAS